MKIRQGTTPTISVTLPNGVPHEDLVAAAITIKQNGQIKVKKNLEDIDFTMAPNYGFIELSQEETLSLSTTSTASIQAAWRANDDNVYRAQPCDIIVERADLPEVI